jgi:hypothetical protein
VSSPQMPFEARKVAGNVGGSHAIVQVLEVIVQIVQLISLGFHLISRFRSSRDRLWLRMQRLCSQRRIKIIVNFKLNGLSFSLCCSALVERTVARYSPFELSRKLAFTFTSH